MSPSILTTPPGLRRALASAALGLLFLCGPAHAQLDRGAANEAVRVAPAALDTITAKGLRAHLEVLASDGFQGRLTGTLSQVATAHYIAAHFQRCGLEPWGTEDAGGERSWFQHYDVTMQELGRGAGLFAPGGAPLVKGGAWIGLTKPVDEERPLVWTGVSGQGGEIEGAWPVVSLPVTGSQSRSLMGDLFRVMGRLAAINRRQAARGAAAVVVVTEKWSVPLVNAVNFMGVTPMRPQVALGRNERVNRRMMSIPMLIVAGEEARAVLGAMGLEEFEPKGEARSPAAYRLRGEVRPRFTRASNVVGLLRGRDPQLAPQAVVYSCHMDHIGMGADGAPYNGADDNGSGTSTVLEMARAYSKLKGEERPRRSVLFLAVSGEELGLWGSEHFAENPTWPLDRIVANVNMDMIGRSTEKVPSTAVSLTPTYRLGAYSTLARDAAWLGQADAFGLRMVNGDRFYQRSDHYNFASRGVPVVFFCDDEHPDYHMQSDDAPKIEFEKLARVARLAWLLGYRVSNAEERPRELGQREEWFSER